MRPDPLDNTDEERCAVGGDVGSFGRTVVVVGWRGVLTGTVGNDLGPIEVGVGGTAGAEGVGTATAMGAAGVGAGAGTRAGVGAGGELGVEAT